ncbi:hypothetical protein D9623_31440 [Azospirillum brasilense]|nr:hypothetical protein D9623_31440 [Azospirillum brasilense]
MVSRPSRPIAGGPFPSAPDPKAAFRKKCRSMKKALAGLIQPAYNPAPTTPGGGEPGELKHLSSRRKGHQPRLR